MLYKANYVAPTGPGILAGSHPAATQCIGMRQFFLQRKWRHLTLDDMASLDPDDTNLLLTWLKLRHGPQEDDRTGGEIVVRNESSR
jgi:hypothetical protein